MVIVLETPVFSGAYDPRDVTFLLKPIAMQPIAVEEKERRIQGGVHYSEMLSPELPPSRAYLAMFEKARADNDLKLARHINTLAGRIIAHDLCRRGRHAGERPLAIVSLARAGTPIGALLGRALARAGHRSVHYSISIIRGRGVDLNALRHIRERHDADAIVFVDGWTGKGAIAGELRGADGPSRLGIRPVLAVVADPAGRADIAATAEDYVIPSGILNGTISGCISRSILNPDIGPGDFHGCVYLEDLADLDMSQRFIDEIDAIAVMASPQDDGFWHVDDTEALRAGCEAMLAAIIDRYGVTDINRIKPGIAEATRAVLRRVPDRLLVCDVDEPAVQHLVHLARERGVAIDPLPGTSVYRAATVIAALGE